MKIFDAKKAKVGETITLRGWVKTIRKQKTFAFIELNDGSTLSNFQVIAEPSDTVDSLNTGASVEISGVLVESPGAGQSTEMQAGEIKVYDPCNAEDYPLQKKRHSFEFLRTMAHLRPRTNMQGAVARVRNQIAFASHQFFQERGFLYIHTPIITASDCEGAGELFQVTRMNLDRLPMTSDKQIDYSKDFFGKPAFLTVSGQLNAEAMACALSDVYTFGPTFRAENSNTSRHLAEFWMIEPEMAFADLEDDMTVAEAYIKYLINSVLENCPEDMTFFDAFIEKGLLNRLNNVVNEPFERMSYTKAIKVLENCGKKFEFNHEWGADLQSEHERYIAEEYCKKPVILYDYPKSLKPFYMKDNPDGKTVRAMDVLVPKIGELIGGSQREDDYNLLLEKSSNHGLDQEQYRWYLELRKYGSVPHSGFGLGFERSVQFITGVENIRDVNAFPRYPSHCEY